MTNTLTTAQAETLYRQADETLDALSERENKGIRLTPQDNALYTACRNLRDLLTEYNETTQGE